MRIGYIVLCHNQPNLVAKIANKLTYGTENIAVIHVDNKKDDRIFKQLLEDNKQAMFLEQRVPVYWGWGHFALTRECVKYIIDEYDNNKALNKYFKHIFPVDETYFHTIIYNSPFRYKTKDGGPVDEREHETVNSMLNLTYFEYPNQVRIFSCDDIISEDITDNYLYIRKVSMDFCI